MSKSKDACAQAILRRFNLPPLKVKDTESRSPKFVRKHGNRAVELDGLPGERAARAPAHCDRVVDRPRRMESGPPGRGGAARDLPALRGFSAGIGQPSVEHKERKMDSNSYEPLRLIRVGHGGIVERRAAFAVQAG